MSHTINAELLERAHYVQERYVGTYLVDAIDNLVLKNDLEMLEYMVRDAEFQLANEDVNEGLEQTDVY